MRLLAVASVLCPAASCSKVWLVLQVPCCLWTMALLSPNQQSDKESLHACEALPCVEDLPRALAVLLRG